MELSRQVVGYAKQLPLALEVLGSFLFQKNKREWESTLEKLQVIHPDAIQEKLRVSFDSLDAREKGLFLDIACFFVGSKQTSEIMHIFKGCGYFPEIGIGNLCRQCLLKVDESNCLMMHDLIRDMGREIVCEECPEEPGKRSRLWLQEDVLNVLTDKTGTKAVKSIVLKKPEPGSKNDVKEINARAFAKMRRLRLLQLDGVKVGGSFELFSKRLIWLRWRGFRERSIPPNLCMDNLVVLDMAGSTGLERPWNGTKILNKLKFLDFSCTYSLEIPDFSGLTSLEELILHKCGIRDHNTLSSIGTLTSLTTLDLGYNFFTILPASIVRLPRLENLYLDDCSALISLPELPINIRRLTAKGCYEVERIPIESNWWRRSPFLGLVNCNQNKDLSFNFKKSLLRYKEPQSRHDQFSILLASIGGLPWWFNYQSIGPVLSFIVSPLPDHGKIIGFVLCVDTAHCGDYYSSNEVHPCYHIMNITKGRQLREQAVHGIGSQYPQRWITYNLGHKYEVEMEAGDDVQFLVSLNSDICEVKKIGVNLIYEAELSY